MGQSCKSNDIIADLCRSWYQCFTQYFTRGGIRPNATYWNSGGQILDKLYYTKLILFPITQNKFDELCIQMDKNGKCFPLWTDTVKAFIEILREFNIEVHLYSRKTN